MKLGTLALVVLMLSGCASMQNPFAENGAYSGINPPRVHVSQKELKEDMPIKAVFEQIASAEAEPFVAYYKSLVEAKASDEQAKSEGRYRPGDRTDMQKNSLVEFATKGVALVNAECIRWFHSLMEAQIKLDYLSANRNVIKDLGTTLLGLGGANKYFVSTYGALNTAASGVEKNFSQAFLLAPNANKIKSHVFMAMNQRAEVIKTDAGSTKATFANVYDELERYADICTQHTAREIMNTALDQTKTEVSAATDGSRIVTTPTASAAKVEQEQFKKAVDDIKQFKEKAEGQLKEQNSSLSASQTRNQQLEETTKKLGDENKYLKERLEKLEATLRPANVPAAPQAIGQPDAAR